MTKLSCSQVRVRLCRGIRTGKGIRVPWEGLGPSEILADTEVKWNPGLWPQLRTGSGAGLWNQLHLTHFWQSPGHRARQSRMPPTLLAPEEPGDERNVHWNWGADHFLPPPPSCPPPCIFASNTHCPWLLEQCGLKR